MGLSILEIISERYSIDYSVSFVFQLFLSNKFDFDVGIVVAAIIWPLASRMLLAHLIAAQARVRTASLKACAGIVAAPDGHTMEVSPVPLKA